MNYFGENDKKTCMGQIRHMIAQGLDKMKYTKVAGDLTVAQKFTLH